MPNGTASPTTAGINFVTVGAALSGLTWRLNKGQTGSLDVIGLDKAEKKRISAA